MTVSRLTGILQRINKEHKTGNFKEKMINNPQVKFSVDYGLVVEQLKKSLVYFWHVRRRLWFVGGISIWKCGSSLIGMVPSELRCLSIFEVGGTVFMPPNDVLRQGLRGDAGFLGGNGGLMRRVWSRRLVSSMITTINLRW